MNHWQEQKSGPKWKYYLQFSVAWTVVAFLLILFFTKLFTSLWETGGKNMVFLFIAISIIIGFFSTNFTYIGSEKRFQKIIKREEELNQKKD